MSGRGKKWAAVAVIGLVGIVGCSAAASSSEETPQPKAEHAAVAPAPKPEPKPEPKAKPKPVKKIGPKARVEMAIQGTDAGGYVGKLKLQKLGADTEALDIYLTTPEGGFEGPSTGDLDTAAGAAFAAAYGEANYSTRKDTTVIFRGGLVSKATGKDMPDANTGIYSITGAHAREIDWSDTTALENIDWSLYRDFAHPALKG